MELNEAVFREKLRTLNSTSASIEGTSAWVCYHRAHAKRVAAVWEDVFSKADQAKRLSLVYLANDIIQNSRRKGSEFASEFFVVLPRALKHMLTRADAQTQRSVRRVIKIWDDRRVFGHGGSRVLAELLSEAPDTATPSTAHAQGPVAPHPAAAVEAGDPAPAALDAAALDGLLRSLTDALGTVCRTSGAAREAATALAAVPLDTVQRTLDAEGIAQARAALLAAHTAFQADAVALAAAAEVLGGGAVGRQLETQVAVARQAATSAASHLAALDAATMPPPSPDTSGGFARAPQPAAASEHEHVAQPTVDEAAMLASALASKPPVELLDLVRMLNPAQQAIIAGQQPPSADAEEYDPDDPF